MRPLSALLDVALLPLAVAKDALVRPLNFLCHAPNGKSATRQRIEQIEDHFR